MGLDLEIRRNSKLLHLLRLQKTASRRSDYNSGFLPSLPSPSQTSPTHLLFFCSCRQPPLLPTFLGTKHSDRLNLTVQDEELSSPSCRDVFFQRVCGSFNHLQCKSSSFQHERTQLGTPEPLHTCRFISSSSLSTSLFILTPLCS